MKRIWFAAICGLFLALGSAHAQAPNFGPTRIDAGINAYFNVYTGNAYLPLAPWYTYWPYDGHVMTPGPIADAANWPVRPGGRTIGPEPAPITVGMPPNQASATRPAPYYQGPSSYYQAPSYWYCR